MNLPIRSPKARVRTLAFDSDVLSRRVSLKNRVWQRRLLVPVGSYTPLRVPLIFNLRMDPYERSQITSNTYYDWCIEHIYLLVPAQQYVGKFLATFKEFPPSQKPATFNLDNVMEQLQQAGGSK